MPPKAPASVAIALTLCAALTGCSKKSTAPETPTEVVNRDKPNANAQIASQSTFGAANSFTTIWALDPGDDGNYAFYGRDEGVVGAGSLTSAGTPRWFYPVTYVMRDIWTLPASSAVPNGVVLFGKHSTDADAESEAGDVTVFSSSGTLLNQFTLISDSSDVFINAAVPVTDSSFIAVGAERISGIEWPLIVEFVVRAGGTIVRGGHAALRSVAGHLLSDVAALPASGGEIRLFGIDGASGPRQVLGLRVTQGTIAPASVDWSRDVVATLGTRLYLEDIAAAGNEAYVAGYTDDNRKPLAASGELWYSALMLSYSSAGDLRWRTVLSLTNEDELFYHVLVGPGTVYGIGTAAQYVLHNGPDEFGYGLVAKLDPATGTATSSYTVGSEQYRGEFNVAVPHGANLMCGGWTEYDVLNGPYRGWMVNLVPSGATMSSAVAGVGVTPGAAPGAARSEAEMWRRNAR